ncbi:MAG: hypothetical protein V1921_06320 [Candidatus Altiarchaeota archaeon]
MTGTKIVKLKLEDGGAADRLPKLRTHTVDAALSLWDSIEYRSTDYSRDVYEKLLEETRDFNVTNEDIQAIADRLEKNFSKKDDIYSPHKAGILLTVIMQNSSENAFRLKTKTPLSYLGYRLFGGKKITIEGNVDENVGRHMRDGHIHVKGSTGMNAGHGMRNSTIRIDKYGGYWLGREMGEGGEIYVGGDASQNIGQEMTGGKIEVTGNVDNYAGTRMEAGQIIIHGNARHHLGEEMRGGSINVAGNTGKYTADRITGGRIDIGGKVESFGDISDSRGEVYPKGKRVRR